MTSGATGGAVEEQEPRLDEEQDPFADPPASPQREDYAASGSGSVFCFDVPRLVLTNPLSPIVVADGDIDRTRDASIQIPMPIRPFG
jgi:hypothetical protein